MKYTKMPQDEFKLSKIFWGAIHFGRGPMALCLAVGIEKVHNLTISRNQNQPRTWQFKRILSWKIYIVSLCLFNSWDDMKIPSQNPCELVSGFTRCHDFECKSSKFSRDDTPEPPSMAQPPASRCPYEAHFGESKPTYNSCHNAPTHY